jgi:hypothetical protein
MKNTDRISVGNPEGKKHLRRSRRRWNNYIKMILKEIGRGVGYLA